MELYLSPKPQPSVRPGEVCFAAVGLAHGHIYSMVNGLLETGAELWGVWDEDAEEIVRFCRAFPQVCAAASLEELLGAPRFG